MSSSCDHQNFASPDRVSQSLRNDRCQNILYKAVFEHFIEIKRIAVLLLTSKSFQNSSFGANFLVNFIVDNNLIDLLESVIPPSSCFSLQFVPSLYIKKLPNHFEYTSRALVKFFHEMSNTKYLRLQLRSLTLYAASTDVLSCFLESCTEEWPNLQDLTLECCDVDDAGLEIIANNVIQIRTLNLPRSFEITDAGLAHLSKLPNITSLNLRICKAITDVGLEHLSKLSRITSLDLSYCDKITDAGLGHLVKLSDIVSLNISNCGYITDTGLEHIFNMSGIITLNLAFCNNITNDSLQHVTKLTHLKALTIGDIVCYF